MNWKDATIKNILRSMNVQVEKRRRHILVRELIKLAGVLRLRRSLRRIYCRLLGPGGGTLQLEVLGISAKFYVHSQGFAAYLKSLDGEGHLLELLIGKLNPGDCIYDIGAEIGLYTLFLAKVVGKGGQIICFEPENLRHERLRANLKLNGLENVRLFRQALGDSRSEGTLFVGRPGVAPGLTLGPGTKPAPEVQKVQLVEGDRFVHVLNLPLPKAIKIDVEGYELNVIRGLTNTLKNNACKIVCCEIHPSMLPEGIRAENVIDLLKSFGFNCNKRFQRGPTFHVFAEKENL